MKSNIPFGSKSEAAAQALIANGNGNGHYNGKSGSVSSASSSVSSSTENLKMNGFSKTGKKNQSLVFSKLHPISVYRKQTNWNRTDSKTMTFSIKTGTRS